MDNLKQKARERGQKMKLPYAGALLPAEAHELMQQGAKLVDVRTDAELLYVGAVPGSDAGDFAFAALPLFPAVTKPSRSLSIERT